MKTTDLTQNSSTSPRFKRRGLIYLGMICLLSAFTATIQGFAQSGINEQIARRIALPPDESAVNSILPRIAPIQTKGYLIPTGWDNVTASTSVMSTSRGGKFFVSGRLICRNLNGSYSAVPNQTVYLVAGNGVKTFKGKTDRNGRVRISLYSPPAPGLMPPGGSVLLSYTWVYRPSQVFAPSQSRPCFVTFIN